MALVKCRECGQQVSDQAEVCPHCGIKSPARIPASTSSPQTPPAAAPRKKSNGCLLVLGAFIALIVISVVVGAYFNGGSSSESSQPTQTDTSASDADTPSASPVFIGNHGRIVSVTMACPELPDLKAFVNSYSQAEVAKDTVGTEEDVTTAVQAGCITLHPDDKGLVIDSQGFLEGYDRIRTDSDENAYWVPREAMAPIPGQPNNP